MEGDEKEKLKMTSICINPTHKKILKEAGLNLSQFIRNCMKRKVYELKLKNEKEETRE